MPSQSLLDTTKPDGYSDWALMMEMDTGGGWMRVEVIWSHDIWSCGIWSHGIWSSQRLVVMAFRQDISSYNI